VTERAKSPKAGIDFDPQKLVAEINKGFNGSSSIIQAVRPPKDYAGLVKAWLAAKETAEKQGLPFDEPQPSLGTLGSAKFISCEGEERDSGFVLRLSMEADSGQRFVVFVEEKDMVPEMSVWDRPDIEASIAGQIGTRLDEQICHSVAEDLDGKSISSGKWMKTWN
jgi:hypothetical protein